MAGIQGNTETLYIPQGKGSCCSFTNTQSRSQSVMHRCWKNLCCIVIGNDIFSIHYSVSLLYGYLVNSQDGHDPKMNNAIKEATVFQTNFIMF